MAKEYIERNEAIKELRDVYEFENPTASGPFDEYATMLVPRVLKNLPTADVVEVKHGEWIILGECDFQCPECGFRFTSPDDISMFKFCRCGLKMDRKEGTEK